MEFEINGQAVLFAIAAGTMLHPFAMKLTQGMLMEHEGTLGLFVKITLMLAALTVVSIFMVFLGMILTTRRSGRLVVLGPVIWFIGVKSLCVHYLEKEEVDEWMVMIHYAALHIGLYYAFDKLMA